MKANKSFIQMIVLGSGQGVTQDLETGGQN